MQAVALLALLVLLTPGLSDAALPVQDQHGQKANVEAKDAELTQPGSKKPGDHRAKLSKPPNPCEEHKSEKECHKTDEEGRSTSDCRWDYSNKKCNDLDCHHYDEDRARCNEISMCISGESQGEFLCFNDDCHVYNPDVVGGSYYYSGPEATREQLCKDAKHCRHAYKDRDGEPSWSCSWKECKMYNRQLTAKEQCTHMADHCKWSHAGKCIPEEEL